MAYNNKLLSVLAIDDEPITLETISGFLEVEGQRVCQASSGAEGLRKFKSSSFDLVLTDLQMPDVNGFEVLKEIKRLNQEVPVIIISGVEKIDSSIEAFRLGAWDYFKKPINFPLLINSIAKAIERTRLILDNRHYQDTLEYRIQARTAELHKRTIELKSTNERLKNEIKSRIEAVKRQKKLEQEIQKSQNLDSLGSLAGGIAHDFNNLLAAILGYIDCAKLETSPQSGITETLNNAKRVTRMAADLTQELITFAKGGSPRLQKIDVCNLLKDSMLQICQDTEKINFKIKQPSTACLIKGDSNQLGIVFRNVFINAIEAMPDGGNISIEMYAEVLEQNNHLNMEDGSCLHILISDEGRGISEDSIHRIFDPYFTTKSLGPKKGKGLGLSISYSIIKKHRGNISVHSTPGRGTDLSIYLPMGEQTNN